jgi:hypothetical protein
MGTGLVARPIFIGNGRMIFADYNPIRQGHMRPDPCLMSHGRPSQTV